MNPVHIMIGFQVLFVSAVIIFLIKSIMKSKKRIKDFRNISEKLGFTFKESNPSLIEEYSRDFKIFNEGRRNKITAFMEQEKNNITISAFDYQFTTGSGKNSQTHLYTFISFKNDSFSFPAFSLHPEHIGHKLLSFFGESVEKMFLGFKDLDFEDTPVFSEKFLLGGDNADEVKNLFSFDVRKEMEQYADRKKYNISIIAKHNIIIFYMPRNKTKINNFPSLIGTCSNMLNVLKK